MMSGFGTKFASTLRAKLPLPESASYIRSSGELPMVRWQTRLGQPGSWTVRMEGRVTNIDANAFERVMRSLFIGSYDAAKEILLEAIQQGFVEVVEENTQP